MFKELGIFMDEVGKAQGRMIKEALSDKEDKSNDKKDQISDAEIRDLIEQAKSSSDFLKGIALKKDNKDLRP